MRGYINYTCFVNFPSHLGEDKLSAISEERYLCVSGCAYFMLAIAVYTMVPSKHFGKYMHAEFYLILLQSDATAFLKE